MNAVLLATVMSVHSWEQSRKALRAGDFRKAKSCCLAWEFERALARELNFWKQRETSAVGGRGKVRRLHTCPVLESG